MKNIHREQDFFEILEFKDGKARISGEAHYREDEGLGSARVTVKIKTVTGAVVPVEEIKGQCQSCKGYETIIHRCCRCGVVLCPQCVQQEADLNFCAVHYADYLEHYNTWE